MGPIVTAASFVCRRDPGERRPGRPTAVAIAVRWRTRPRVRLPSPSPSASSGTVFKLAHAIAPCLVGCLIAALPAQPGRAQASAPDASVFQRGEWSELGELEGGATLSISHARYREGTVLTFALKTEFASGEQRSTVEVIEMDCATARVRRVSAAATKRNGEMTASNEPGAFETYPAGSVMAQLAEPLCGRASGE